MATQSTTQTLPIGTAVKTRTADTLSDLHGIITGVHLTGPIVRIATGRFAGSISTFLWSEVRPSHARPYDPATERQKIVLGNTMSHTAKHWNRQHSSDLGLYDGNYPRREDRLNALERNQA